MVGQHDINLEISVVGPRGGLDSIERTSLAAAVVALGSHNSTMVPTLGSL
jgi:hypothetical protein